MKDWAQRIMAVLPQLLRNEPDAEHITISFKIPRAEAEAAVRAYQRAMKGRLT